MMSDTAGQVFTVIVNESYNKNVGNISVNHNSHYYVKLLFVKFYKYEILFSKV